MGGANKVTCLGMEIGDIVNITFTPNDIGDPIQQYGQVIRVNHSIEVGRHDMFISVASLDWTFLVLDDVVFGKLDNNNALAF